MKKFLRFIGVLLLIIVVGFLILCFIAPKEAKVERSIVINAPKEVVWDQMVHFKNWSNWSPWQEKDSTIVVTLNGQDGQPGSSYSWTSKNSGVGNVTNTKVEGTKMFFNMHFIEPFEAKPDGFVMVEDGGNNTTKATWAFHGESNFIMGGMMMLMDLTGGGVKKDYDRGLQLLKNYSEKHAHDMPASNFNIETIQFPATTYAGIRKTLQMSDMEAATKFFSDSYGALANAAGNRITGPATGLYYTWDEKTSTTNMAAAFPVSGTAPVKGAEMLKVDAAKGYKIVYTGGYYGSAKAHEAAMMHISKTGETRTLAIEEYIKGPGEEQDSTKWVTNIIYLVK